MRDRIEKRLLQFLRLMGNLCGAAFFQRPLFVHKEGELRSKGVEQFALFHRWRICETHGQHTFGAVAGDKRDVQCVGIRQCLGRSSGALFFLKRPDGDAFIFARWRERAGRMTGKAALVAQPNRRISFESFFDQRQNFRQGFIEIAAGSESSCETIKRGSPFFTPALRLFALA